MNMGGSCQETTTTLLSYFLAVTFGVYKLWQHMMQYSNTIIEMQLTPFQYMLSDEISLLFCLNV